MPEQTGDLRRGREMGGYAKRETSLLRGTAGTTRKKLRPLTENR